MPNLMHLGVIHNFKLVQDLEYSFPNLSPYHTVHSENVDITSFSMYINVFKHSYVYKIYPLPLVYYLNTCMKAEKIVP